MKVHLVDGTYELFRHYYGAPSAVHQGQQVGAVRGLYKSLAALCALDDVTHVGVAFDTCIESFRNQLFAGYKTGDGIEPELLSQFPLAEAAAKALGVVVWPMIDFEADDALCTFAHIAAADPRVSQVVIASPDKDLAQVVDGQRIVLWDRMRKKVYDEDGVQEKFGVPPRAIPDFLALVGDSADGIPGIPRWGEKSSGTVLRRYGRLEDIPLDPDRWDIAVRGKAALCENLSQQRDQALLYRQLATLRRDVPLTESVDALALVDPLGAPLSALGL